MAAVDLPLTGAGSRPGAGPGPGVITVDAGDAYSLRVFDAGLACCGVEVAAALRRAGALAAAGEGTEQSAPVNVFVVAGTVTDKLAPFVLKAFQDTPPPRRVLSFGACSHSGGALLGSPFVGQGGGPPLSPGGFLSPRPPPPPGPPLSLAVVLRPRGRARVQSAD